MGRAYTHRSEGMGRAYGVSPKPGIIRDEVCCGAIALLDGVGSGDARTYCRRCKGQLRLRNLIRRFRTLVLTVVSKPDCRSVSLKRRNNTRLAGLQALRKKNKKSVRCCRTSLSREDPRTKKQSDQHNKIGHEQGGLPVSAI